MTSQSICVDELGFTCANCCSRKLVLLLLAVVLAAAAVLAESLLL
jgi:hypothetical protein